METNRFGMTQFQERLNFQRGLEGELTRSIQALSSVQGAGASGAAQSERFFGSSKTIGIGFGEFASRAHTGSSPVGGHCSPGCLQRP